MLLHYRECDEGGRTLRQSKSDRVLAYDEETGEQAYKPVVHLFRNETKEGYHVRVNGEEIVCTGGHPFYVLNAAEERQKVNYEGQTEGTRGAWICANKLQVGDEVLLSDGSVSVIGDVQHETLTAPETTYNFEVADFHTYYVSDSKVLVHNACANPNGKKGGEAHQNKINEIKKTAEDLGYTVKTEVAYNTTGGFKSKRYADLVLSKPGAEDIVVQVGRVGKKLKPVIRERRAIRDLLTQGNKVIFSAYNDDVIWIIMNL